MYGHWTIIFLSTENISQLKFNMLNFIYQLQTQ